MAKTSSITKRRLKDKAFYLVVILFSILAAVPLVAILAEVVMKGYHQINLAFFTEVAPTTFDAMMAKQTGASIPGGILNGIIGTLLMVVMAAVVSIPVGILGGVYLYEKPKGFFSSVVRFSTELIQGTPSIIIGFIVYAWVVVPLGDYSAIAGAVALAIMMIPLIVRSTEETLKMLPSSLKEAALALGGNYTSVILKVMLPTAFNGIFTGILLSISRVMGETAPLMLTALGSTMVNWDISRPSSAVSLLIWEFYNDPNLANLVWSASLFLLIIILSLNILAKYMAKKTTK